MSRLYKHFKNSLSNLPTDISNIVSVFQETYSINLHDEQLIAVLAMLDGYMVEMSTGEGKTYCIGLYSAIMNTRTGSQTIIVTTNSALAYRDYNILNKALSELGITCDYNRPASELTTYNEIIETKSKTFDSAIVFTSSEELCYDYLRNRNNTFSYWSTNLENVIVDEADLILSDNATTKCVIVDDIESELDIKKCFYYNMLSTLITQLTYTEITQDMLSKKSINLWEVDYVNVPDVKEIHITEQGVSTILDTIGLDLNNDIEVYYMLVTLLNVYHNYKHGRDFVVQDGKAIVLNQSTGRSSSNSRYELNIQNAIESLCGLELTNISKSEESISYQVFFSKFKKITGLSGTLIDIKDELRDIYGVEVFKIPTHFKLIRKDYPTIYTSTQKEKIALFLDDILYDCRNHNPKLVIIEDESSMLSIFNMLRNAIPSSFTINTLSNENIEDEVDLIIKAGNDYTITISTAIMGRGTDIIPTSELGLSVFCLSHFENSRIDNQIRGRSGRQGKYGETHFYSSFEDTIWQRINPAKTNLIRLTGSKLDNKRKHLQAMHTSQEHSLRKMMYLTGMVDEELYNTWMLVLDSKNIIDIIKNYNFTTNLYELPTWFHYLKLGYYAVKLDEIFDFKSKHQAYQEVKYTLEHYQQNITGSDMKSAIADYKLKALDTLYYILIKFIEEYITYEETDYYIEYIKE